MSNVVTDTCSDRKGTNTEDVLPCENEAFWCPFKSDIQKLKNQVHLTVYLRPISR